MEQRTRAPHRMVRWLARTNQKERALPARLWREVRYSKPVPLNYNKKTMTLVKRRKLKTKIAPLKLIEAGTALLWLATACFFYFVPPKNNLIISLAFLLLFLCLFAPALSLLKAALAALFLSLGLWLLLLFQFFSLLTLPLGLTTFFLAGLITLYILLKRG